MLSVWMTFAGGMDKIDGRNRQNCASFTHYRPNLTHTSSAHSLVLK